MSAPPFVRFYANDWYAGVSSLKADERGVYVSMCVYIWTTGKRVPLDDAEASRAMSLQFNLYQRVRDKLLRLEKITKNVDGYGNPRAEFELNKAAQARSDAGTGVQANGGSTANPGPDGRAQQSTPKRDEQSGAQTHTSGGQASSENASINDPILNTPTGAPMGSPIGTQAGAPIGSGQKEQQNQSPSIEPEPITIKIDVVDDGARAKLASSMKRITDAAKPILRDGGMSATLMGTSSEIAKWLKDGCDIDADILPVIEAAVAKGAVVSSWKFFSQSIVDAKASREAPLPTAKPAPGVTHAADRNRTARYPTKHDRLQAVVAKCLDRNAGPSARPDWARDLDGDALTIVPGA